MYSGLANISDGGFYGNTSFFISNIFINNANLKLAKNQANAKDHLEAELLLFENYLSSSSTFLSKNNRTIKNKQKNKCACIHEIILVIILKMKNRSHRYDIDRIRSWHCHTLKYKTFLSMVMLTCTKRHLSNIWSSIHQKRKEHEGWVERKALFIKKRVVHGKSAFIDIW